MKTPCSRCGGEVPVRQESLVVECPFCNSRLFVDLGRSVLHYRVRPVLDERRARGSLSSALRRRQPGAQPRVGPAALLHLPFWATETASGKRLRCAVALVPEAVRTLPMPASDLVFFDADEMPEGQVVYPDEHLTAPPGTQGPAGARPDLVHLPFYRLSYKSGAGSFEAHVDAVSGRVCADEWPPIQGGGGDRPFALALAGVGAIFLLEALLLHSAAVSALAIALTALPAVLLARRVSGGAGGP
jgi:DNA-directed RNA polymerase subunit RPC12/RpoP